MRNAIVFFDLDLTLLNDDKAVPPENLAAISALQAHNILPVLCTGKNRWEITPILASTGIDTAICANGADIYIGGTHVFQSPIGQPQLQALLTQAKADELPVAMFNPETVKLTQATAATKAEFEMMRQPDPAVAPAWAKEVPLCMLLLFTPKTPAGERVGDRYRAQFPQFTFYRNGPYALDVVNRGCTKGTGVKLLLGLPQFHGVKSFAFGDGHNDIPMLEAVDYGIAMGNAEPAVAAVADYQTADYRHAGIPRALEHFGLGLGERS